MTEKPGDPTPEQLAADLSGAVRRLVRRFRGVSPQTGLSPSQRSVLARLDGDGPTTTAGLARAELVRPQSMRLTVAALEETGARPAHAGPRRRPSVRRLRDRPGPPHPHRDARRQARLARRGARRRARPGRTPPTRRRRRAVGAAGAQVEGRAAGPVGGRRTARFRGQAHRAAADRLPAQPAQHHDDLHRPGADRARLRRRRRRHRLARLRPLPRQRRRPARPRQTRRQHRARAGSSSAGLVVVVASGLVGRARPRIPAGCSSPGCCSASVRRRPIRPRWPSCATSHARLGRPTPRTVLGPTLLRRPRQRGGRPDARRAARRDRRDGAASSPSTCPSRSSPSAARCAGSRRTGRAAGPREGRRSERAGPAGHTAVHRRADRAWSSSCSTWRTRSGGCSPPSPYSPPC